MAAPRLSCQKPPPRSCLFLGDCLASFLKNGLLSCHYCLGAEAKGFSSQFLLIHSQERLGLHPKTSHPSGAGAVWTPTQMTAGAGEKGL